MGHPVKTWLLGPIMNEWLDSLNVLTSSLLTGLRTVLRLSERARVLFVDGLDEYEGSKTDLPQSVQDLIQISYTANFKSCFSSPFEPPFSTLFQQYPSISGVKVPRWSHAKMGRYLGTKKRGDESLSKKKMAEA